MLQRHDRHPAGAAAGLFVALAAWAPHASAASRFVPVTPCRVIDTRNADAPLAGPALAAGATRAFTLTGTCGVSTSADALAVNLTVTGGTTPGDLTVWTGAGGAPSATAISFRANQTRANNAVIGVSPTGGVSVLNRQATGTVHLILDVVGYFIPTTAIDVSAGPPRTVALPSEATLAGSVLPAGGGTTYAWTFVSGPGDVAFTTPGAATTNAAFTLPGTYRVRLTATRGAVSGWGETTVTVGAASMTGGTLYLANLTPENGAVTSASGTATLRLSNDETWALMQVTFGNLTTPLSSQHVHGPADPGSTAPPLYDLDEEPHQPDGLYLWVFRNVGGQTPASIVTALKAGRLYVNIHSTRYPSGEIRGHFGLVTGSSTFTPPPAPPALPGGLPTTTDAARFLMQATWGPTQALIDNVKAVGFTSWLNAQVATPAASHVAYVQAEEAAGVEVGQDQEMEALWKQAITGNDALRARVAIALSEIFVISGNDGDVGDAYAMSSWMDLLNRNAFGNYRTLLQEITLHPGMGLYLDMLANDKEDPDSGQNPNENYAREILQLFSIGLYKLHPDGTLVLDASGRPIPTYDQSVVEGLARVFTGWSWGGNDTSQYWDFWWPPVRDFKLPMVAWPNHHSTGPKKILNGVTLPAGQTAAKDLSDALDAIAAHPNVGPFLSRLLIQRLVTSNPSPAYVYRVAQKFENDGTGVRGNLGAVVRAILTDWEARAVEVQGLQGYGKQKEPFIRLGALFRAFNGHATSGKFKIYWLDDPIWALGQNPLRAPSVFNFFLPDYRLPGPLTAAGLVAPEFQITTETTAISTANFMNWMSWGGYGDGVDEVRIDVAPLLSLTNDQLLDRLNLLLMANGMSPAMRSVLQNMLVQMAGDTAEDRVRSAISVVVTSPEFVIQR